MATLLRPLVDRAVVVAGDRYENILNFKRELRSLKKIVSRIEGALPEAEDNPRIRDWWRELDDICYDTRDILDEFVTAVAASKRVKSNSLISFKLRLRLTKKIKKYRKKLSRITEDKRTIREFVGENIGEQRNRPEADASPDRHPFVGREFEKEEIMKKLLNPKDNHVEVVPIWGMGGVGKTALARSVYNDERVTNELYPLKNRRWLCVGEKNFHAKEIISTIIDESGTDNVVQYYQKKLNDKFTGDRFLIVLDDVWDVGINEWELFCNPLNKIRKGGLIILTTRTREVITAIDTPVPDVLKSLSNEDCWQIFESHVFTDVMIEKKRGYNCNRHSCSDLEQKKGIGKKIVEKLKGLPLAVKAVGRSLSSMSDVQIWRSFLETEEWKLSTGDDDVMIELTWSYNRLPQHLKQCFAYCSLFPKDHVFDEKLLVAMWMAHGFIQSVKGGVENRRPEDIGALYFEQLVNASLFQCVDGRYVMHDMIHDLSILVSNKKILRTDGLRLDVGQLENVRHIAIRPRLFWENQSLSISKRSTLKRLYTLHTLPETFIAQTTIKDIFKRLKRIRVLVLVSDRINCIPECIRDLIHLRYLDIKETNVSIIPDTLCDLHNLQTLVARVDDLVVTVLPKNIVKMDNLRHLRARLSTCNGVKNLTSLQELHSISVSEGDQISELGDMQQLHGYLEIICLENVTSEEDAAQARMQEKIYIDHLELEFTEGLRNTDVQTKVLDALQCPPNLRYLVIRGYNGLTCPSWMVDGKLIMNLKSLYLTKCHQLELLLPLGQLNCQKDLEFYTMGAIKKLGEEFYGKQINQKVFFPSLETLELGYMENLKEWDDIVIEDTSVTFFPCLKTLYISSCPKLVSALPHVKICTPHMDIKDPSRNVANVMRSLSELRISKCDGLVVLELDILVSLKHLVISGCSNLTCITSAVNAIEELNVHECENLMSLSFSGRGLNSLQSLIVLKCPKLEILFEHGLTSSLALRLSRCLMLEKLFQHALTSSSALRLSSIRTDNRLVFSKMFENDLVSLREMCIGRFPKVESLFNEIVKNNWHILTLLETLIIHRCDDLESLPPDIHKLSSLKKLWLRDCPKLQALPADGLPLSLEVLLIAECPLLYDRCQRESSADWNMIRRIPKREIVQTLPDDRVLELTRRFQFGGLLDILDKITLK